jgi:hypothetical protein
VPLQLQQLYLIIGAGAIIDVNGGLDVLQVPLRPAVASAKQARNAAEKRLAFCGVRQLLGLIKRRNAQMSKCGAFARHRHEAGNFSGGSKYETTTDTMKYALLVHQSQEHFDNRDNAASMAAGRAYGEALQICGCLGPGQNAKMKKNEELS